MKITKEYRIEMEAMAKALKIAKEKGVEALEEELKLRGATKMPITVSAAKGRAWMEQTTQDIIESVLLMSLCVLKDEFGYGEKRLNQFLDRYSEKTDCMAHGYVCWEDLQEEMTEKLGKDFNITALCDGHRAKEVAKRREKEMEELSKRLREVE